MNADLTPYVRLRVQKTYKLFVNGQFIRSESGRSRQVMDQDGDEQGLGENVPRASRKDARDAVRAAVDAFGSWSARTAYNRGQILYRLAEVMEARATELARELNRALALSFDEARREVDAAIDRAVHFAGWSDKFQSLLASSNPVAGPHFNFSVPEPMGVVAIVAPPRPSLLGLLAALLPVIVSGNTCVVLVSEEDPRTPLTFAECLATSDLPAGVVNLLSAPVAEVAPHLAKHMDVASLALWNVEPNLRRALELDAASNVKRVRSFQATEAELLQAPSKGLVMIERFIELKTIWHPMGL